MTTRIDKKLSLRETEENVGTQNKHYRTRNIIYYFLHTITLLNR